MANISGDLRFGGVLGGLFDNVNDIIQDAAQEFKNAGMELEIQAGQELARAIDQLGNFYKDQLDYTMDKVKKEAKDAFDRLNSMVQEFQKKNFDELNDLKLEAQQLANSFPFASKQPQLSSIKPRYLVIGDVAKASLIIFKGNFPCSAKSGFEPTLMFAGKPCYLLDASTQSLTFQVPHEAFKDAMKDQYSFKTGVLTTPWDDGFIFSHKTSYEYRVGLGALPQLAGKVTAEYIAKKTERHEELTRTQEYIYNGNDHYPTKLWTHFETVYPKPGWTIDVSKPPHLSVRHVHGEHQQEIVSFNAHSIVFKVGLSCKAGKNIGIVGITMSFNQYLDQTVDEKRVESFPINWKDSKLLEPQGNEVISKVIFDDYNGKQQQFAAPDLDRSVLKVRSEGNGKWKVWAEPPKELEKTQISKGLRDKIETVNKLRHLFLVSNLPKELKTVMKNS